MYVGNITKWLIDAERDSGDRIESVVVGRHHSFQSSSTSPMADENVILSREEAIAKLDVDFDRGYGGPDCFPVFAWTKNRVYFISQYDGKTKLSYVPRHPVACAPEFDWLDAEYAEEV